MDKHEMREAAIKRLRETMKRHPASLTNEYIVNALVGYDKWLTTTSDDAESIIDLLTDDEPSYEDDAYTMGPRDADGIFWSRGDMSDSPWGVIEGVVYDCTRREWLVRGHDISAPWVPADSIRHAPMRTATQRENDLIRLIKDAARDYESLQADYRDMDDEVYENYIKLPKDANNKVIHLWDKITYHGPCEKYQDRVFEVRGYGARAGRPIDSVVVLCDSHLETLTAYYCKRYHKPTVDEILDELEGMRGTGDYDDVVERCADLAGMLRELLKED